MARINVVRIVLDHFKTLRSLNQSYNFMNIWDILLFIFSPFVVAVTLTLNNFTFEQNVSDLIATISIIGGFLFNLLVVIYSQIDNIKNDINDAVDVNYDKKVRIKFINEIHVNISFAIVLSIFTLLSLLSTSIDIPVFLPADLIRFFLIFINYFLMILFTLTLLMIISRIYILFKKELN